MIPVNEPLLGGNEKKYLNECIDTGWISSEGPFVSRFEQEFAKRVERKHGIAVCNGTAALELAIAVLDIGVGDEVILPTFTIISCAAAIVRAGAIPVTVDCDPDNWNMSIDQITERITARTKAIMVVHIYGLPARVDEIIEIANEHNIHVIEDAAHVHGVEYKSKTCGSYGIISVFSFYSNKVITTGEGGMVLTDDDKLADRCRSLMNLCFQPNRRFVHEELGWNFRISNLQAAVGLAQLEQLDKFLAIKRAIGERYQQGLGDISEIQLPPRLFNGTENVYWVFGVVLKDKIKMDAREVMARLREKGVATRPFFWPMHKQPVFIKKGITGNEQHPVAERIARRGFYIPSGMALSEDQQCSVIEAMHEIIN